MGVAEITDLVPFQRARPAAFGFGDAEYRPMARGTLLDDDEARTT